MKTHIVQKTKHELRHDINEKIPFELQEIGWNLNDENKLQADEKNKN